MNDLVSQDEHFVFVEFRIPKVANSKVESLLTEHFLKVNVVEEKFLKIVDFAKEIDPNSSENKIEFSNGVCRAKVQKASLEIWNEILLDPKSQRELVKSRRAASLANFEQSQKDFYEKKTKLKTEHDRYATSEMMRIEGAERKLQEEKKAEIKEAALEEIFRDLDIPPNAEQNKKDISSIPIRAPQSHTLEFTEKLYPHIASRESQLKDAPLPRIKALAKATKDEVGLKNPLWLKDQGDNFFSNGDFLSAANAYSSALSIRPEFPACISNRAATFLKLKEANAVVKDCERILELVKEDCEMRAKAYMRMAVAYALLGDFNSSRTQLSTCQSSNFYSEPTFAGESLLSKIETRESTMKLKSEGDSHFKIGDLHKARDIYSQCLQREEDNEWVLANIALVDLKLGDFSSALEVIEKAKGKLENTEQNNISHDLLTKLNLRAAACFTEIGEDDKAISSLQEILSIDPSNEEAKKKLKTLQAKLQEKKAKSLISQESANLQSQEYAEALETLEKAQKLLDSDVHTIDFLSILLNKCLCFHNFSLFDDIINTCMRGIRICKAVKSRVSSFYSQEERKKVEGLELRFYVRRANAYAVQNLIHNAKSDLKEALRIEPGNSGIKADLERIEELIINEGN